MAILWLQLALLCIYFQVIEAWDFPKRKTATPAVTLAAIEVGVSQVWDGSEGNWSSFALRIGSGPQSQLIRVMPSTSMESIWATIPDGCPGPQWKGGLGRCIEQRGGLYDHNKSLSTYKSVGIYGLGNVQALKNYGINTSVGIGKDTVTLNYQGAGGVSLDQQVIFENADIPYTLTGLLGLNPYPVNLSDLGDMNFRSPSYMEELRSHKLIPSLSYGYTAGAKYRNDGLGVFGSLTLGGYDAARFDNKTEGQFHFFDDMEKHLMVRVESITWNYAKNEDTSGSPPFSGGFTALIESSRAFLYLPPKACDNIAKEWGLNWDNATQYYILNDTAHKRNIQMKPFLRFKLGELGSQVSQPGDNGPKTNSSTTITIPYDALAHPLDFPYVTSPKLFVPIRPSNNPESYVLGRAFLQEAYLTVDYERKIFKVAQANFPAGSKLIKSIHTVNETNIVEGPKLPIPKAAIAGIAAGAAALIALLLLALFWLHRVKKTRKREVEEAAAIKESNLQDPHSPASPDDSMRKGFDVTELDSGIVHEAGGVPTYPRQEMSGDSTSPAIGEMADESTLMSYGGFYKETNDKDTGRPIIKVFYEMDATPPGSTDNTPTGTLNISGIGSTLVNTTSPENKDKALLSANNGRRGDDLSPIPQTPLEFYGAAAAPGPSGQRGWIGRAPDLPKVVLVPATPASPTPGEVERSRWLNGHSGRRKKRD